MAESPEKNEVVFEQVSGFFATKNENQSLIH